MRKLLPIFFAFLLFSISGCYIARIITVNVPTANDYKYLPKHSISANNANGYFQFINVSAKNLLKIDSFEYATKKYNLSDFLKDHKTQAFLIIKNDSLYYEEYFNNCSEKKYVTSFSISKSIISALIGIAIDEGKIKDEFEPITNYLPELFEKDSLFSRIRIIDLLQMRSGLWLNENFYNPFSDIGKAYFGRNLKKLIRKLKIDNEPGVKFNYFNYNTQILAFILEKATGKKTADYLSEKIWNPLGMESKASWSIDSRTHGNVKAYCCINGIARDYARFGRLFLKNGNWDGKQIISANWIEKSTSPASQSLSYYGYQWWLANGNKGDFLAAGILGQYIYVYPEKNLIILRFGKSKDGVRWEKVFIELSSKIK
jgi:CubicO group peptidase (beta-lactamase class C family)